MSAALKKPVAGPLPPLYVGFKKKYRRPDKEVTPALWEYRLRRLNPVV